MSRKPKHDAVTQAFLDLLTVRTTLHIQALHKQPISPEDMQGLADLTESAANLLQRTILRAGRILEQGVGEDE